MLLIILLLVFPTLTPTATNQLMWAIGIAFIFAAMKLGKLQPADPVVATRHLHSLLESELLERFLFQLLGEVSIEEIKAITARAIDVFMAAYAPRQP